MGCQIAPRPDRVSYEANTTATACLMKEAASCGWRDEKKRGERWVLVPVGSWCPCFLSCRLSLFLLALLSKWVLSALSFCLRSLSVIAIALYSLRASSSSPHVPETNHPTNPTTIAAFACPPFPRSHDYRSYYSAALPPQIIVCLSLPYSFTQHSYNCPLLSHFVSTFRHSLHGLSQPTTPPSLSPH